MSAHRYKEEDPSQIKEKAENAFYHNYAQRTKGYQIHVKEDPEDRGDFSGYPCDTCGSRLGGNRTKCILMNTGTDAQGREHHIVNVLSCDDCIYYAANGKLPE